MMDVVQELTPRSSLTLAGSYGLLHFVNDVPNSINSRQVSGQAGFNYQLNRADQIGIVYGFQDFHFPERSEPLKGLTWRMSYTVAGSRSEWI